MVDFLHSNSTQTLTGTYDFRTGVMSLPSGTAEPAGVGGRIFHIGQSGTLVLHDGTSWKYLYQSGTVAGWLGVESGFYPTDATVSGGLLWWGEPSGIHAGTAQVSGADEWRYVGFGGTDTVLRKARFANYTAANQPYIASGITPRGENALYGDAVGPTRGMLLQDGDTDMGIGGTDAGRTWFIVSRIDATSGVATTSEGVMVSYNNAANARFRFTSSNNNRPGIGLVFIKTDTAGAAITMRQSPNIAVSGSWNIWSVVHSGTVSAIYRNGLQIASSGQNVGAQALTQCFVMGAPSGNLPLAGAMAEMIVFNSGVGEDARTNIENYLSSRHNISLER
jgi:hypothetical protein